VKKGIFFQVIVIFIVLLGWNLLHLGFQFQKDIFEDSISSSPMMLLSMQENTLKQLRTKIENNDYIKEVTIIQDSVIAKILIENYDLENSMKYLDHICCPQQCR